MKLSEQLREIAVAIESDWYLSAKRVLEAADRLDELEGGMEAPRDYNVLKRLADLEGWRDEVDIFCHRAAQRLAELEGDGLENHIEMVDCRLEAHDERIEKLEKSQTTAFLCFCSECDERGSCNRSIWGGRVKPECFRPEKPTTCGTCRFPYRDGPTTDLMPCAVAMSGRGEPCKDGDPVKWVHDYTEACPKHEEVKR